LAVTGPYDGILSPSKIGEIPVCDLLDLGPIGSSRA
jgi:hypothetical protein